MNAICTCTPWHNRWAKVYAQAINYIVMYVCCSHWTPPGTHWAHRRPVGPIGLLGPLGPQDHDLDHSPIGAIGSMHMPAMYVHSDVLHGAHSHMGLWGCGGGEGTLAYHPTPPIIDAICDWS